MTYTGGPFGPFASPPQETKEELFIVKEKRARLWHALSRKTNDKTFCGKLLKGGYTVSDYHDWDFVTCSQCHQLKRVNL